MGCEDVDEITAQLERCKTKNHFSLAASNDGSVHLAKDDLRECAFFEGMFNRQPNLTELRLSVNINILDAIWHFVKGNQHFELESAFEAILFGRDINWTRFIRYCCDIATAVDATADCDVDDICFVVQAFIRHLPTRTFESYEPLVALTRSLTSDKSVLVIDKMIEALSEKQDDLVKPLPLSLFENQVTVALMNDVQDRPITAILHVEGNTWLPFNIFGPNFCPFVAKVRNFHLVFSRYVVYERADGQVLFRNLRLPNKPARVLFHSCKFFRSRCNQLHVISEDENRRADCVYEWNHATTSFTRKFSRPSWGLQSAHTTPLGSLGIVTDAGKAFRFREGNNYLARLNGDFSDFVDCCQMRVGQRGYTVRTRDLGTNEHSIVELSKFVHAGYTHLSVFDDEDGLYRTHRYTDRWQEVNVTNLHGPVTTISDVLL